MEGTHHIDLQSCITGKTSGFERPRAHSATDTFTGVVFELTLIMLNGCEEEFTQLPQCHMVEQEESGNAKLKEEESDSHLIPSIRLRPKPLEKKRKPGVQSRWWPTTCKRAKGREVVKNELLRVLSSGAEIIDEGGAWEPDTGKLQPLPEVGKGEREKDILRTIVNSGPLKGLEPKPDVVAEKLSSLYQLPSVLVAKLEHSDVEFTDPSMRQTVGCIDSQEIDRKINESVKEVVISSVKHAMRAPLRDRFKDLPTSNMKEILFQRMLEENYDKGHADHREETKKKSKQGSPKTPPGSPPSPPPPPPLPSGASGASGTTGASDSAQAPPPPPPSLSTHQGGQSTSTAAPSSSKIAA
ncbi:hypothetical protein Tco_0459387 [Tanacetum coccineum]